MADEKQEKATEKAPETAQTEKTDAKPLPASARKPGQNYATAKFKK